MQLKNETLLMHTTNFHAKAAAHIDPPYWKIFHICIVENCQQKTLSTHFKTSIDYCTKNHISSSKVLVKDDLPEKSH